MEFDSGHIANAININYYSANFYTQIDALDHNKMYLLHCWAGSRSLPTFNHMIAVHFREVYHMNNGISTWISAGYPTVKTVTAVENLNATKLIELYPNPANNYLNVSFESESTGKLFLFDLTGKVIREEFLDPGLQSIDVSGIPKGMYIIKIESDKDVYTEKITIL